MSNKATPFSQHGNYSPYINSATQFNPPRTKQITKEIIGGVSTTGEGHITTETISVKDKDLFSNGGWVKGDNQYVEILGGKILYCYLSLTDTLGQSGTLTFNTARFFINKGAITEPIKFTVAIYELTGNTEVGNVLDYDNSSITTNGTSEVTELPTTYVGFVEVNFTNNVVLDADKNYFLAIKDTGNNPDDIYLKCVGNQGSTFPLQTLYIGQDIAGNFPNTMINSNGNQFIPAAPYFLLYKK